VLHVIPSQGIAEIVKLGDHVSRPLEASHAADLLIERGFPSVRGDRTAALSNFTGTGVKRHSEECLCRTRKASCAGNRLAVGGRDPVEITSGKL
jgi:hypothetical protein